MDLTAPPEADGQRLSAAAALDLYLDHLTLRGRSPATLRAYAASITAFFSFLASRRGPASCLPVDTLQPSDVAAFLLQATRAGRAPATRSAYLTALTAFFRFLILQGHYPGTVERLRAQLAELTVKGVRRRPAPDQRLPGLLRAA